jgi:hypothetical protein
MMTSLQLHELSAALFAPHVGSNFTLEAEGVSALGVTLSSCVEHPRATPPGAPRTAFSLIFHCPTAFAPPEGGHFTLAHAAVGRVGPVYVERVQSGDVTHATASFEIVFS